MDGAELLEGLLRTTVFMPSLHNEYLTMKALVRCSARG